MNDKITIAGNNIAALTCALKLLEKGKAVELVTPSKNLGGHFSGIEYDGYAFDYGMIFFEFTSFSEEINPQIEEYDPQNKSISGKFVKTVESFIHDLDIQTHKVSTPLLWHQGDFFNDMIISDKFDFLDSLSPETQALITRELDDILQNSGNNDFHASKKNSLKHFVEKNLNEISILNHGKTLHNLVIEKFCHKLTGESTTKFLAKYHRAIWLPLFYPETIRLYLCTQNIELKDLDFYYVKNKSMNCLVRALKDKLQSYRNCKIIQQKIHRIEHKNNFNLYLDSGSLIETQNLVWGLDSSYLLEAISGEPQKEFAKASIAFGFILLKSNEIKKTFSTVFILDEHIKAYRLTNLSHCSQENSEVSRLVIEFNLNYLKRNNITIDELSLTHEIENTLLSMEVIKSRTSILNINVKIAKNALFLPSFENYEIYQDQQKKIQQISPNIHRIGSSLGFTMTSTNDQIIQGLKVAAMLK